MPQNKKRRPQTLNLFALKYIDLSIRLHTIQTQKPQQGMSAIYIAAIYISILVMCFRWYMNIFC